MPTTRLLRWRRRPSPSGRRRGSAEVAAEHERARRPAATARHSAGRGARTRRPEGRRRRTGRAREPTTRASRGTRSRPRLAADHARARPRSGSPDPCPSPRSHARKSPPFSATERTTAGLDPGERHRGRRDAATSAIRRSAGDAPRTSCGSRIGKARATRTRRGTPTTGTPTKVAKTPGTTFSITGRARARRRNPGRRSAGSPSPRRRASRTRARAWCMNCDV